MKLHDLNESIKIADSVKTLFTEAVNPLKTTLMDVASIIQDQDYTLIGGLALGFHSQPRGTNDIDILIRSEAELDDVIDKLVRSGKFKKIRDHAVEHHQSQVEVELLTPEFLSQDPNIIDYAINNSTKSDLAGVPVNITSAKALVVLKLKRNSLQDQADIQKLIGLGVDDISDVTDDVELIDRFEKVKNH